MEPNTHIKAFSTFEVFKTPMDELQCRIVHSNTHLEIT